MHRNNEAGNFCLNDDKRKGRLKTCFLVFRRPFGRLRMVY
ncbi:hypothetical protein HMPREF3156_01784 [Neisseria sp. HMSC06F02]|nr:hypothetical protein HMPREF3156_01784 [Neisseria sp. HMSC06F02]